MSYFKSLLVRMRMFAASMLIKFLLLGAACFWATLIMSCQLMYPNDSFCIATATVT